MIKIPLFFAKKKKHENYCLIYYSYNIKLMLFILTNNNLSIIMYDISIFYYECYFFMLEKMSLFSFAMMLYNVQVCDLNCSNNIHLAIDHYICLIFVVFYRSTFSFQNYSGLYFTLN